MLKTESIICINFNWYPEVLRFCVIHVVAKCTTCASQLSSYGYYIMAFITRLKLLYMFNFLGFIVFTIGYLFELQVIRSK